MAYTPITKIENVAQAEEIVRYGFIYHDDMYEAAVNYLLTNKPDSVALKKYTVKDADDKIDVNGSIYKAAKEYPIHAMSTGNSEPELKQAAEQYAKAYEARSDLTDDDLDMDGSVSAEESYEQLGVDLEAFEQGSNPEWKNIVKDIKSRIKMYQPKSMSEDWDDMDSTIWDTVKTKILINRTLNKEWQEVMKKSAAEKDDWLREEIKRVYTAEIMAESGATKFKAPNRKQRILGSQDNADYNASIQKAAQEAFDEIVKNNGKIVLHLDQVMAGAANAYMKYNSFADYVGNAVDKAKKKIYNSAFADKVKKGAEAFDAKMEKRHPKIWKFAKSAAESFKASKWQMYSGLAATGVVIFSGAGAGMLTAYAAYMAVSSWIWPIANKKALELNRAKKTNNPTAIARWEGKEGWKNAWKKITDNGHEKFGYVVKGTIGTLISGFGAGYLAQNADVAANLFGSTEILNNAQVQEVTKAAIIRTQQAIVRTVGSVMGQLGTFVGEGVGYALNRSEENNAYFKQSGIGLLLAGGLGSLAALWQVHNLENLNATPSKVASLMSNPEDSELQDTLKTQRDSSLVEKVLAQKGDTVYTQKGDSIFMKLKNFVLGTKDSSGDPKHTGAMEALKAAADQDANLKAENAALEHFFGKDTNGNPRLPMEYEDGLGVNKTQFNTIRNQLGKLLAQQKVADAAGTEVANPDKLYADAVRNVAVYLNEHPEIANGKNPIQMIEQVLHRHRLSLGHFNEKIVVEGEGTFGVSRKVGGQWVYGDPSFNKDMNAWFDIMCDGKPKEEGADLMAPLANLDKDQAEALLHGNGNRVVVNDCDVTLVRYGAKHMPKIQTPPVQVPPEQQPTGPVAGGDSVQIVEQPTGPVAGGDEVEPTLTPVVRVDTYRGVSVGNPNDIAPGTGRAKKIAETYIVSGKPDPTELLLNSKKQIIK